MRYEYAVSEGEKMTTNKELLSLRTANTPRGVGTQTNIFADRARNAEIWDVDGKRYIDFGSGIAVVNTGHSHPEIVAAVKSQVEAFSHTCVMVTPYGSAVELAERLNAAAPSFTQNSLACVPVLAK